MVDQSSVALIDGIGLKSWNASSCGEDPQARQRAQVLALPGSFLILGGEFQGALNIEILVSERAPDERSGERREERSREMEWLTANAQRLSAYRGEWLLITDQGLIEHSANAEDIRRQVMLRNIKKPFVYYVPTSGEDNFIF